MQLPYHNTKIKHWNPGATMPLILPVHVICNTSDEQIMENIRANSRLDKEWVKLEPAHDGVAILCGSGPSIADDLEAIREWQKSGAAVFAMNGCAAFLASNGILPEYQVMIDARIETAELIGPARRHLFASQVHQECFKREPDAEIWHLQVGGIEQEFPDYQGPYALIGGAASVGNTALCLAYVLGFRKIHCYGYDSSHQDGAGHAFEQKLNDGDPCAVVEFNGKQYVASLTMKLQAEKFIDTAHALQAEGCSIEVHGAGLLPDIWRNQHLTLPEELEAAEKAKYEAMWAIPGYRNFAPGEHHADAAFQYLEMKAGDDVLDFGVGTGRGAAKLMARGVHVTGIDLAENSLDADCRHVPAINACLWNLPDITAKHGFCTDVMEHIPPEKVDAVLNGIAARVEDCYFNISTQPDAMGALIGQMLHLTVQPGKWWHEQLAKHWRYVWLQDQGGEVVAVCRR